MANSENNDHTIHQEQSHLGLLFAQALRCFDGIVELANILNTEETYLKSSLISVYTLCHLNGNL